jgi:hypothetical protein
MLVKFVEHVKSHMTAHGLKLSLENFAEGEPATIHSISTLS